MEHVTTDSRALSGVVNSMMFLFFKDIGTVKFVLADEKILTTPSIKTTVLTDFTGHTSPIVHGLGASKCELCRSNMRGTI